MIILAALLGLFVGTAIGIFAVSLMAMSARASETIENPLTGTELDEIALSSGGGHVD